VLLGRTLVALGVVALGVVVLDLDLGAFAGGRRLLLEVQQQLQLPQALWMVYEVRTGQLILDPRVVGFLYVDRDRSKAGRSPDPKSRLRGHPVRGDRELSGGERHLPGAHRVMQRPLDGVLRVRHTAHLRPQVRGIVGPAELQWH
jgi:hypothetical protein